jgi:hypothetical protein
MQALSPKRHQQPLYPPHCPTSHYSAHLSQTRLPSKATARPCHNNLGTLPCQRVGGRLLPHGLGQKRSLADRVKGTGTLFFIKKSEPRVIAFNQLMEQLAPYSYEPTPFTPGLWRHQTKQIMFALCVDNFGVKYFSLLGPNHLINTVKAIYDLTIDWTVDLYCGLSLNWDYNKSYVNVSIPGYIDRALKKFELPAPLDPQYVPHKGSSPPIDPRNRNALPLLPKPSHSTRMVPPRSNPSMSP